MFQSTVTSTDSPSKVCQITQHKDTQSLKPYIGGMSSEHQRQCSSSLADASAVVSIIILKFHKIRSNTIIAVNTNLSLNLNITKL